jgi:CIC family chloride channel protein
MTEKLARRGLRIHQDYETDVLQQTLVSETMDRQVPTVSGDMLVRELAESIARREPGTSRHQALVVVDQENRLTGIITRGDVFRALDQDKAGTMTVFEAGTRNVIVTFPDEALSEASARMLRNNVGRLPVVDRKEPTHAVGYLGRHGIMAARWHRLDEEHVREPGWIKRRK